MDEQQLAPLVSTGESDGDRLFAARASLPPEILRDAAKRLSAVSLIYAITYAGAFLVPLFLAWLHDLDNRTGPVGLAVATLSIVASLVIFKHARAARVDPSVLVDLALIYLVVSSFGIAMGEFWGVRNLATLVRSDWVGISWVSVWIVIFPVIVPSTPGKTLLASFAAATMVPLVLVLSLAFGATDSVPGLFWAGVFLTGYLCAGIAYASSRIIYGLGARLRKAREMGSYRLVERLGAGAMGEVWRAEHRLLARPAAIKLIRQERVSRRLDDTLSGLRRRFEREARATAALTSPHTVELHDFGLTEAGQFYYAMELLQGVDLESLVQRFGPLPAERVVHLLRQVCESLADAHYHGVIHRDIKPANIFVCRLGPVVDFVKVLDFGLVKAFGQSGEEATRLTAEGVATGTPAFMSPETFDGDANVDPRADLYSLACTAYVLLTGELVFESGTPMGMLVHHAKTQPVPPSQRTEQQIPRALEDAIMQCLEKDPDSRPAGAAQLERMLDQVQLGAPWSQERARSWWDLHLPEPG